MMVHWQPNIAKSSSVLFLTRRGACCTNVLKRNMGCQVRYWSLIIPPSFSKPANRMLRCRSVVGRQVLCFSLHASERDYLGDDLKTRPSNDSLRSVYRLVDFGTSHELHNACSFPLGLRMPVMPTLFCGDDFRLQLINSLYRALLTQPTTPTLYPTKPPILSRSRLASFCHFLSCSTRPFSLTIMSP